MHEVLWQPSAKFVAQSRITAFAAHIGFALEGKDNGYDALWQWSIENREAFWSAVWDFTNVIGDKGTVILGADAMPGADWFPEAKLNFAENLLAHSGTQEALVFYGEDGQRVAISRDALREQVGNLQAKLVQWGVEAGDRVAAFLPNCTEAVVGMLAASSLGAVWSSCSPDFGERGVLDRFGQIEPKVLIATESYFFKGKHIDARDKLRAIVAGLPSLEKIVLISFLGKEPRENWCEQQGLVCSWSETQAPEAANTLSFKRLPFAHPLYVMFSSGTTGQPKCIVHGQGGTLLQHRKEHVLHCDLREGERFFYYTTTGWMMWNWLVTGLATGATVVLFDGNPFHPVPTAMWDLIDREQLHVFGTSAKYLDACKKANLKPAQSHQLEKLRLILSTGSPLVAESFDWVYQDVKADVQLASITGGTDLLSCFALGCPIAPVRRGELQKRGLGMAVDVWQDENQPIVDQAGELVCTKSFPSMPTGFWNDDDGSRYFSAYFDTYPGIWRHGDWVALTSNQGIIVYGRSDATLNPGGVRIGTAEIYRQVERFQEVEEAVVIGQDTGDGDQRVVLFLRLAENVELDQALEDRLRREIREQATPRHVPAVICAVSDIPRTRSGKISEIAVRDVVHGRPVKNTEALANPEALEEYRERPQLTLD
ncbi:MAG: acetoacetate--CoA ligase [Planctomycetota bacterium]|nr:acetoacetate--CoA ligase [Planctomycetota bacterium]MDA1112753.1 acetoacetate--CoA ligase [Planctomycetota bacterium]